MLPSVFSVAPASAPLAAAAASAVASASVPIAAAAVAPYKEQSAGWPAMGRHILAYHDAEGVVVYQAFNSAIADYAVANQTFKGCPQYSTERMTWIKTNFMWMMYRSGWGTKDSDQERVLAIKIRHEGMRELLASAATKGGKSTSKVRLQWDPDHTPAGSSLRRQAIQLGLKGDIAKSFVRDFTIRIEDVTETLVRPQWPIVLPAATKWMAVNKRRETEKQRWTEAQQAAWSTYLNADAKGVSMDALVSPIETLYPVDAVLAAHLGMGPAAASDDDGME